MGEGGSVCGEMREALGSIGLDLGEVLLELELDLLQLLARRRPVVREARARCEAACTAHHVSCDRSFGYQVLILKHLNVGIVHDDLITHSWIRHVLP